MFIHNECKAEVQNGNTIIKTIFNEEIGKANLMLILFLNWRLKAHPNWSSFPKWDFDQAQWYFPFYLSAAVNRSPNPGKSLIPWTHPHSFVNIQDFTYGITQLLNGSLFFHCIPVIVWISPVQGNASSLIRQATNSSVWNCKNITDEEFTKIRIEGLENPLSQHPPGYINQWQHVAGLLVGLHVSISEAVLL